MGNPTQIEPDKNSTPRKLTHHNNMILVIFVSKYANVIETKIWLIELKSVIVIQCQEWINII